MHTLNTDVQALKKPAPQNGGFENVAPVEMTEEIVRDILAIQSGDAPISVVYEWAFKAIAMASQAVGSIDLGDVDHMDSKQARAALDEIQAGAKYLRHIAPAFDRYPYFAAVIKFHLNALFYAEATLIPLYMLSNKTAVARKSSGISTYIVRHPLTGMIKIGRTTDVASRIKGLQTGAGAILTTLAVIPKDVEQSLHARFADLRRHGEWFEDVGAVISNFAKTLGAE